MDEKRDRMHDVPIFDIQRREPKTGSQCSDNHEEDRERQEQE